MSNAERPVQNGEVGNSANGTIPYFVSRISYFVLRTWYIVLSNAERPVQNGEVGNSANGTIPYFVSRISYLVHCTLYFVQK